MVKKAAQATPNRQLRAARKERGWTQQQVADRIGAPLSLNISRWESGTAFPSAYYIERLCHLFGKSVRELELSQLDDEVQDERPLPPTAAVQTSSEQRQEVEEQDDRYPDTNAERWTFSSAADLGKPLAPRTNLPAPLTTLIGRESEVTTASTLLCSPQFRLLTLVGPAGVGKTSVALHVASALLDAFADGVYFVPLAPIRDPQLLISTVAQRLGLTERGNQPLLDVLKLALQEKHLLLVLDNFEQLVTVAPLLAELLSACHTLKLLVTSREVLHLRGEQPLRLSPLALPEMQQLPAFADLLHYPAIDLFLRRVRAFQPDFQLTESNARVIAEICTRLDGLPLALELAAARLKVLSPQALLAGLEHSLRILTMGPRDLPERHQTLRKTIQWSYELLSGLEQRLFRQLSLFVGGCTFQALAAVSEAVGDGTDRVLDTLTALIDKSLVQRGVPAEEEPRFTMLETIREYGLECLTESEEQAITRQTHAFYYLAFAEEAKPSLRGPQQTTWFSRLERELENLRAAMHWSLEQGGSGQSMEIALRLGDALEQFWMTRGLYSEGTLFLERALATSEGVAPAVRARALIAAANLVSMQGNYRQGERLAQESLALCQQLEDTIGIARSLFQLGRAALVKGNLALAREHMEKSVEVRRKIADQRWVALSQYQLATLLTDQGEYARASILCKESVKILREVGYKEGLAFVLVALAWTTFVAQGSLSLVQSSIEEGLALAREVDSRGTAADFLRLSGWVALHRGDAHSARLLIEESLALSREVGASEGMTLSLLLLGKMLAGQGDYSGANACYEECFSLCRAMNIKLNIPACLEGVAAAVAAQGNAVWAAQLWGAASALRDAMGMPIPAVERAAHDAMVTAVRTQLGEKAFTAAWSQGRTMTPEQAYAAQETTMASPLSPENNR